jgi:hypothetical protein
LPHGARYLRYRAAFCHKSGGRSEFAQDRARGASATGQR